MTISHSQARLLPLHRLSGWYCCGQKGVSHRADAEPSDHQAVPDVAESWRTQAREYLYFRLFGQQHVTPIAMMTSDAKDNHRRLCEVMRAFSWFGRGPASFR